MITRRKLFGWLAGGAAAAAVVKPKESQAAVEVVENLGNGWQRTTKTMGSREWEVVRAQCMTASIGCQEIFIVVGKS
jgi:hypothetical protein